MKESTERAIYWIAGTRTPFLRSGTGFEDLTAYDLAREAIAGLLAVSGLDPARVDTVILGTVVSNIANSNVARDAALAAGIPDSTPAHTVSQACISANRAICSGAEMIRSGRAELVLAGGTESLSDIPILFRKRFRRKLLASQRYRSIFDYLGFVRGLRPSDLLPEVPSIAEFSTGLTMGADCERLTGRYGVSRLEQDEFAVRSHRRAARAWEEGKLGPEVCPVRTRPSFREITRDNGFRPDTNLAQLARLKPAFSKPYGSVTAGNSSFLTDGAAAVLLASDKACRDFGLKPRIALRDWVFTAQSPQDSLLLGPALAVPRLLATNQLELPQIEVLEFHEAFAGQVVANLKCLASPDFNRDRLGRDTPLGEVDPERLNRWGGSLSLGHPFGATGARLLTTTARRLLDEGARWGLTASCAAGGLGSAILLEQIGTDRF